MRITEYRDTDILLTNVPVGNIPMGRAKTYMEDMEEHFKKFFTNPMMLMPTKLDEYSVEILRKE